MDCPQCKTKMNKQKCPAKFLHWEKQNVWHCPKDGFMIADSGYWEGYRPADSSHLGYLISRILTGDWF